MQKEYRKQIDEIDEKLVELFCERMDVAKKIGAYKKENGLPVLDAKREKEKLQSVKALSKNEYSNYVEKLYNKIFELSREYQNNFFDGDNEVK